MPGLVQRLLRLPLVLIPKKTIVPVLSGKNTGLRWIVGAATHGCWIGTYERDTQRLFGAHIRPGEVVWDVGANAGFFTLLASRLVGQDGYVYAFEPLPRNLDYLHSHLRLNRIENVRVLPLALSDQGGVARFARAESPAMGGISAIGELEVKTEALDAILSSGQIQRPDFIKMDIEGGEHKALQGASAALRAAQPTILLSAHGHVQFEACSQFLRDIGYSVESLRDGSRDGNYVILAVRR